MEKERLQEYAARVTQANRSELVVIIYEATLASIEAVSYTHLLIIKNYGDLNHKIYFVQNLRSSEDYIYKHVLNVAISVSYTHLDVYKRQQHPMRKQCFRQNRLKLFLYPLHAPLHCECKNQDGHP